MGKVPKISEAVVRRLPIYLRYLTNLQDNQVKTISSQQMGKTMDINPAQIRKDLSAFGDFGKKGIGYDVEYLIDKIRHILKLDQAIHVALVGAGNLGQAISNYNVYLKDNMKIIAIFDADPNKIGKDLGGLMIESIDKMAEAIQERNIRMAIITTPASAAQEVADRLIHAGIETILNFAPATIRTDKDVKIDHADLTSSLQSLAYYLQDKTAD
ncbi:redox-sensing transcriptional repressor Rex [Brevibacillus daliensis]|uniref:redox-sensing transcriptional repressor Rex n=1 Tax=Brevibacillus daliensis TaxID=2892995 RepID=UPI001E3D43D2|nr:redox-sensing transcriptional repressor Rex [Brevibacillus daliensis]